MTYELKEWGVNFLNLRISTFLSKLDEFLAESWGWSHIWNQGLCFGKTPECRAVMCLMWLIQVSIVLFIYWVRFTILLLRQICLLFVTYEGVCVRKGVEVRRFDVISHFFSKNATLHLKCFFSKSLRLSIFIFSNPPWGITGDDKTLNKTS